MKLASFAPVKGSYLSLSILGAMGSRRLFDQHESHKPRSIVTLCYTLQLSSRHYNPLQLPHSANSPTAEQLEPSRVQHSHCEPWSSVFTKNHQPFPPSTARDSGPTMSQPVSHPVGPTREKNVFSLRFLIGQFLRGVVPGLDLPSPRCKRIPRSGGTWRVHASPVEAQP